MTATVDVLGIRHHGPGSARSVARALDELRPDAVSYTHLTLPTICSV